MRIVFVTPHPSLSFFFSLFVIIPGASFHSERFFMAFFSSQHKKEMSSFFTFNQKCATKFIGNVNRRETYYSFENRYAFDARMLMLL